MFKRLPIIAIIFGILNNLSITYLYCQSEEETIKKLSVSQYFLGYKYVYGNEIINRKKFYELAELVPSAKVNLKSAKSKRCYAGISAFAGGVLIGWPIVEKLLGRESPNWRLAGIGSVLIFVYIVFESSLTKDYQKAATNFNMNIGKLNPSVVDYIVNKNRYNRYLFNFKLKDGQIIQGELLSKRGGELFVKDRTTIYVITLEKLSAIYQDKEDVTDSILRAAPTKNIDLFNYDVKEIN